MASQNQTQDFNAQKQDNNPSSQGGSNPRIQEPASKVDNNTVKDEPLAEGTNAKKQVQSSSQVD